MTTKGNPTFTTKAQRHNSDSCLSVFAVKKQIRNPTFTTKAQRDNSDSCLSVFVVKKQNSKSVKSAMVR